MYGPVRGLLQPALPLMPAALPLPEHCWARRSCGRCSRATRKPLPTWWIAY